MQPARTARDPGYHSPPFIWTEDERRHLRARLDALSKDAAAYILDTFPIVRRRDKAAFLNSRAPSHGPRLLHALAAGDTDVDVAA